MDKVVWIASYPKSGNTWLRHLVTVLVTGDEKASLHTFTPSMHSEVGKDRQELYEFRGNYVSFLKTHHQPDRENISQHESRGLIYVLRNPMDVLLSSLNFLYHENRENTFIGKILKTPDQIKRDGELDYYIDQFIEMDGLKIYEGMTGGYRKHIEQWCSLPLPSCVFIYEDMVRNPYENIARLGKFIGVDHSQETITKVYETVEGRTAKDSKFFWKKSACNYLNYFSGTQILKMATAYADHPSIINMYKYL